MATPYGDPETFNDRTELFEDLAQALEPDAPFSVLAVIDLAGSAEHRQLAGEVVNGELLAKLAGTLSTFLPRDARRYRSRHDEFCVLIDGQLRPVEAILEAAMTALHAVGAQDSIYASYGVAVLPDEAANPLEALMTADRHLDLARRVRERRHAPVRAEPKKDR